MIVLVLYLVLLVIVRMLPEKSRFPAIRSIALWSFAAIPLPFFMIVVASGTVRYAALDDVQHSRPDQQQLAAAVRLSQPADADRPGHRMRRRLLQLSAEAVFAARGVLGAGRQFLHRNVPDVRASRSLRSW